MVENDLLSGVWPEWKIIRRIGGGSYGTVYEAAMSDSESQRAAIKIISIPQHEADLDSLRTDGMDEAASKTYLRSIVNDFVNEIKIMEMLKGHPNIVAIEDYRVIEKDSSIGWNIYIRMELLTPFYLYTCDHTMSEANVIKLGIDVCNALEACNEHNIIHRDVKPENICVDAFGHFKLGDFGVARKLENMTGGLSQKGSYDYMAPEISREMDYDSTVDIYSLGLVLYRLLNKNRLPFLPVDKKLLTHGERIAANRRRMTGEAMAAPCEASPKMAQIILQACAYDPEERFVAAKAMKNALVRLSETAETETPKMIQDEQPDENEGKEIKPKKYFLLRAAAALVIAAAAIVLIIGISQLNKKSVNTEGPNSASGHLAENSDEGTESEEAGILDVIDEDDETTEPAESESTVSETGERIECEC